MARLLVKRVIQQNETLSTEDLLVSMFQSKAGCHSLLNQLPLNAVFLIQTKQHIHQSIQVMDGLW